ncbi:MAG: MFS transporter [Elainellaceae cyanobacterium]
MPNSLTEENPPSSLQEVPQQPIALNFASPALPVKPSKEKIRSSLSASTLDGVFATVFSNVTGGVLLSNFLVELHANALQIGLLASIPMMANLLQPLGAHWADRAPSRWLYSLWVYGISRLLWLPLAIGIIWFSQHPDKPQQMIWATLAIILMTHFLGAIGSASWLSWLAVLVPRQIRGRYFGFRNSICSLTGLVTILLSGVVVSRWWGGTLQGFGVLMLIAVVAGLVSLGFQSRMTDVSPQAQHMVVLEAEPEQPAHLYPTTPLTKTAAENLLKDKQFLLFLLYFGLWAFGINLCAPFFNLYLLSNLALSVSWVTFYNGLGAAANLLMLLLWGKLADRIGNRPILLLDGLLVAFIPLLWLATDRQPISLWLWFPLLHLLGGGTGAAIDLCINNLQLEIAPVRYQTKYFAATAAIGGICGAIGCMAGGSLVQWSSTNGMFAAFILSSGVRFLALLPLFWLKEPRSYSLKQIMQRFTLPMPLAEQEQAVLSGASGALK